MITTNSKTVKLSNYPDSKWFWKGLGGNFDSFTQIVNEFIDNSLSEFLKNDQGEIKKILIRVEELIGEKYSVEIEDTGSGISNLNAAFSLGNKTAQVSSLNEHGFGMKHALAAANKENNNWSVLTRTEKDKMNHSYTKVEAPFDIMNQQSEYITDDGWPGIQSTGTIIRFIVDKPWLKTITRGLRGNYSNLKSMMEVLSEDLGYTYSTFIAKNIASMTIRYKSLDMSNYNTIDVPALRPHHNDIISPGIGTKEIDLGNGEVTIEYEFLQAIESPYKKYYKANMSTSGVEIRINGRLLADNLFTEIWGKEKHNSYNYILIRINVVSDDKVKLPSTTTNKDGLRQDDPKLNAIYNWIRSKLSDPKRQASLSDHEIDLFDQLREKKLKILGEFDSSIIVDRERYAFTSVNEKIRIDLYQSVNNKNTIYEGKKDKRTPQDLYQLLMYWDGLVMDKVPVDEAIIIAAEHPESVRALVNVKNEAKDALGNQYKIKLKTWQSEDIAYPN